MSVKGSGQVLNRAVCDERGKNGVARDICDFCAGLIPEAQAAAHTSGVSGPLYDVNTRGNQRQTYFAMMERYKGYWISGSALS